MGQPFAAEGCPYVDFWSEILSFFPYFEFFLQILFIESCPYFEFGAKNGIEFLPEVEKVSFFRTWVFAKMLKK